MSIDYLHNHPEFDDLIHIVSEEMGIIPILVEKDYWVMHCLYGLRKLQMDFFLKGGTSLSKGYGLIDRFSEDIDILIEPPGDMDVAIGKNQDKDNHRSSRKKYYDWLSSEIHIDGITNVERDYAFDDDKYRSGGIRLYYSTKLSLNADIKSGILLEVGFDKVAPYSKKLISSWIYEYASPKVEIIDNRAIDIPCYHPGYTLVEKLQTISTKFRKQQSSQIFSENFMRHYYDVFKLIQDEDVKKFIGTNEYILHKIERFRSDDILDISVNPAFIMNDVVTYSAYERQYNLSQSLYYKDKPTFEIIISHIREMSHIL